MTYRSVGVVLPMERWRSEYAVQEYPVGLPMPVQRAELASTASEYNRHPVLAAFMASADSLWDYWRPWPGPVSRDNIHSLGDGLRYTAAWLDARAEFVERLLAINEQWTMFAPRVDTERIHLRARLFFDDGSDFVIRQKAEPADYTHYGHWFDDRTVIYESQAYESDDTSWSYCNLLSNHYPRNANGAKLVKIVLFCVNLKMPLPGADAMAHYREQNILTADPPRLAGAFRSDYAKAASSQVWPDYYEFDPETLEGSHLADGNK